MMPQQLLDWARAGPRRLLCGFGSAIDLHLEDILPTVSAQLILVHAEFDPLTSFAYTARLAADHGGRAHGARLDCLGLDTKKFPHDIGFLGRYGPALDRLDRARRLWSALPVADALTGLAAAGLSVEEEGPAARTDGGT